MYILLFPTSLIHTGTDKPKVLYLFGHVRELIALKWYYVGIELLEQGEALRKIKANNAGSVSECCADMLKLWLRRQPNATWNQLIFALRSPSVQLNDVAIEIEGQLTPSGEGD